MNAPLVTTRWRLVTSAEDESAAQAAGTSLLAGLLVADEVPLSVAPYFKGGFQVEFSLTHAEGRDRAEAWLLSGFERTCVDYTRVEGLDRSVSVWSHSLNIPRVEALEAVMS